MVFKIVIAVFKANKTAILMKDDFDKKSLFAIVISELCQIDVDSYIHTYLPTYLRTYIHTYTRTHARTHARTHTHTHTHTYIRLLKLPLQGFSVPMGSLFNN